MQTSTSMQLDKKLNSTKIVLAQKGFTLIEMMVVMAMMAVLLLMMIRQQMQQQMQRSCT